MLLINITRSLNKCFNITRKLPLEDALRQPRSQHVEHLALRVWDSVEGVGCVVQDLGLMILGHELRVRGVGSMTRGQGFRKVHDFGSRVQEGACSKDKGFGFRVLGM